MSATVYELCAIGNALVDIILPADDAFLSLNDVAKGSMTLVDDARSSALYQRAETIAGQRTTISSGGSAANTLAGFASLGGRACYQGKVGTDKFGTAFTHDLRAQGIQFGTPPSTDLATGKCLIFVTPDAQRSMNTFLGAATAFGPQDVDATLIQNSSVTYLEGYLFDRDEAKAAFHKATEIAHTAGRKLALSLSDSFCVSRHREAFRELVAKGVDILFGNEEELKALYETEDLRAALRQAGAHTDLTVATRGAEGAFIAAREQIIETKAHPVSAVIDTTGAGDLYAAGFLFGYTRGMDVPQAAKIGAQAAAEVISHYGPRPLQPLRELI